MKRGICLAAILLLSAPAFAHPGKTDRYDGHKCWKNCGEWELVYGEYHFHDKDRKPIRIDSKGNPMSPVNPETSSARDDMRPADVIDSAGRKQAPPSPKGQNYEKEDGAKPDIQHNYITIVREEIITPSSILLLSLALVLLLALILMRRKRDKKD